MGIPYYVASLIQKHKKIQKKCGSTLVEVDVLGIDFNCFIHKYLDEENPVGSIVVALERLLTETVRAKQVYIAFDGLVPLAKMVQQRYRRMRIQDHTDFDKHQISPGTPFMKQLAKTLKFLYPNFVISGTDEPGEGEHKIFTWLRTIENRNTICIYGLDADLVLISLAQSHLGDIHILRELETDEFALISINELKEVIPLDVDRYVQLSLMCFGNDFLPCMPMFSLREEGYGRALHFAGRDDAWKNEKQVFMKRAKDTDRHIVSRDGHEINTRYAVHLMDGVINWEPVVYAFWKTYHWVYHYFTTSEVLDWNWYYPYPEAPTMEILEDFDKVNEFTWVTPNPSITVEQQLQFILPEKSLKDAGYESVFPDELYDEEIETRHPFMRRFKWECDPYVSLPIRPLTSVDEIHLL